MPPRHLLPDVVPNRLGPLLIAAIARHYSLGHLTDAELMERFVDPFERTFFNRHLPQHFDCDVAYHSRGQALNLLESLMQYSYPDTNRWIPVPAWWASAAEEAIATIAALGDTPPSARCGAMMTAACDNSSAILQTISYTVKGGDFDQPGCADVTLIRSSLAANANGERLVAELLQRPDAKLSDQQLVQLADLVELSSFGRIAKAPPLSWWPAAARFLLQSIGTHREVAEREGCRAYRAMGLVSRCGESSPFGVLREDEERLKGVVADSVKK